MSLTLPASGLADATPPGATRIGPPATLGGVVFARDGTIYGTVAGSIEAATLGPVALWRSGDHGRTWSSIYRLPAGWRLTVLQASPGDPGTVYASQASPRGDAEGSVQRIDAGTGRATPLPFARLLGLDAAGTAYGLVTPSAARRFIVGCGRRADACKPLDNALPNLITGRDDAPWPGVTRPAGSLRLVADPSDSGRFVSIGLDSTQLSDDGGGSWRPLRDAKFGVSLLDPDWAAGSGSYLYSPARGAIWASADGGGTWTRTERAPDETVWRFEVSRDDPRVAYAQASAGETSTEIRTLDGGASWHALPGSPTRPVTWIAPGDPLHVFSWTGNGDILESADGGLTWVATTQDRWCVVRTMADATSATGVRLRCSGFWSAADPLRALPQPLPYAPGLVGAPELPGALAVAQVPDALGVESLLGELRSDWTWTSLLGATGAFGPSPAGALAVTAWPSAAGTAYYARDTKAGVAWVRRGTGRWWRLQIAGRDVSVVSALDATHVFVMARGWFPEQSILDLSHPAVTPPSLQTGAAGLACVTSWSAADADTAGFGWLRDGQAIAGASGPAYAPSGRDAGHSLACQATARTDFGSSTLISDAYAVPAAKAVLAGTARAGGKLRCGAGGRITWLRDGIGVKGAHARTYTVRTRDRSHALACQARLADGGIARSRAVLIAP